MRADRETYTHGHAASVLRSHASRTVADSAAYLIPYLRPGARVLDVGCGPGTITADLAARVAPGPVLGIEPTPGPLADARARAAAVGAENAVFALGDVYALDHPDGAFDVVHAHQVLQHLGDPVAALREMLRVCAPEGIVAARDADYAAMTWYPADPRLDRWLAVYRAVAHGNGAEPDAGRRLLGWANAAGAGEVTASASVWCYATPESRAWWGGMWADRVVSSDLARSALARSRASRDDLDRIAGGWRRWAADPDGWLSILHGEILARP